MKILFPQPSGGNIQMESTPFGNCSYVNFFFELYIAVEYAYLFIAGKNPLELCSYLIAILVVFCQSLPIVRSWQLFLLMN